MPDMRPMTARDWRVAVFAFVAACAAVATFGLAEHAVDRRLHLIDALEVAA